MSHAMFAKRFAVIGRYDHNGVVPPGLSARPIEKVPNPLVREAHFGIVTVPVTVAEIGALGVLNIGFMGV